MGWTSASTKWVRTGKVTERAQTRAPESIRAEALEGIEVECTHCGVRMTSHRGSGQRVKYFRCGSCHRWVSSTYTDVFRADTKVRTHPERPASEVSESFSSVKNRLDRWLSALDDQDPYRLLGVSPMDSHEVIRARYLELAMASHPDRGGSPERMRDLNVAYERIVRHGEKRRQESLSAGRDARREALLAQMG